MLCRVVLRTCSAMHHSRHLHDYSSQQTSFLEMILECMFPQSQKHQSYSNIAFFSPQEIATLKAKRRRNLYTAAGVLLLSLGTYLAHKFGFINFFNIAPVRLLTDLTGITTVTVNDDRRRR